MLWASTAGPRLPALGGQARGELGVAHTGKLRAAHSPQPLLSCFSWQLHSLWSWADFSSFPACVCMGAALGGILQKLTMLEEPPNSPSCVGGRVAGTWLFPSSVHCGPGPPAGSQVLESSMLLGNASTSHVPLKHL